MPQAGAGATAGAVAGFGSGGKEVRVEGRGFSVEATDRDAGEEVRARVVCRGLGVADEDTDDERSVIGRGEGSTWWAVPAGVDWLKGFLGVDCGVLAPLLWREEGFADRCAADEAGLDASFCDRECDR